MMLNRTISCPVFADLENCTKFGQLILSKIIKTVVTMQLQISSLKCTEFDFGSAPPEPLAGFKEGEGKGEGKGGKGRPTSKGREGKEGRRWRKGGDEKKGAGRGEERRAGEGRGRVSGFSSFSADPATLGLDHRSGSYKESRKRTVANGMVACLV